MAFRNIVLLSDGTGNSSISPTKSNVWRLFESLDLGPNAAGEYTQFAFYDDGVGTSGFKLLRIIGGGFGWGLSRNVRELYRKLCREYEPGDRIYIFGFSRGAFTARVLAHFIIKCGILDRSKPAPGSKLTMETERGLRRGVKQAYKSYRCGYWAKASLPLRIISWPFRHLRNLIPRFRVHDPKTFKGKYSLPPENKKSIEFIGVWDTVDALGLPIDELAMLIDRWVYPYKFPNQELSTDVGRACQALAIDDERQSFHPLLWDESNAATENDPSRLVYRHALECRRGVRGRQSRAHPARLDDRRGTSKTGFGRTRLQRSKPRRLPAKGRAARQALQFAAGRGGLLPLFAAQHPRPLPPEGGQAARDEQGRDQAP